VDKDEARRDGGQDEGEENKSDGESTDDDDDAGDDDDDDDDDDSTPFVFLFLRAPSLFVPSSFSTPSFFASSSFVSIKHLACLGGRGGVRTLVTCIAHDGEGGAVQVKCILFAHELILWRGRMADVDQLYARA
jgi:hypothetical protein